LVPPHPAKIVAENAPLRAAVGAGTAALPPRRARGRSVAWEFFRLVDRDLFDLTLDWLAAVAG